MRRILMTAAIGLAVLVGSTAAAAAPTGGALPVPPAPATAAQPPKAPGIAGKAAAAASAVPVFTGYLTCFSGYIYTDFTDPDGDDTKLNVQVWALRRSNSTWAVTWLLNTGPSAHGVFYWLNAPDVNLNTADVSYYYFRAMDQTGTWSAWTVASGGTDGSCSLL